MAEYRQVALDKVFETIADRLPLASNKALLLENLTQNMTKTYGDEIAVAKLTDPNVQTTLTLAVVNANTMQNTPQLALNFGTMLKQKNDLEAKELDQLKDKLKKMLAEVNQLESDETKQEPENVLNDCVNKIVDQAKESDAETLAENKPLVTLIEDSYIPLTIENAKFAAIN